jgi:hypothetical protein
MHRKGKALSLARDCLSLDISLSTANKKTPPGDESRWSPCYSILSLLGGANTAEPRREKEKGKGDIVDNKGKGDIVDNRVEQGVAADRPRE